MSGTTGVNGQPGPLGRVSGDGVKRFELGRTASTISTATGAFRVYNDSGEDLEIISTRASVGTAPTAASLIVDINKAGTTIFTTQTSRPTILAAAFTAQGAAPDVTSWANGTYLTFDVDQVGSSVAGADLVVAVWAKPATPA